MGPDVRRDPEYACRIAHGCLAFETVATLRPDLDSAAQLKVIEKIELANGEGLALFASGYLPYPDAFQEEDRQRAGLVDGRGLDLVALFQ